jgi:hypothetical protein
MNDSTTDRPDDAGEPADRAQQDLNATADAIQSDIGRLAAIEDEKRALDVEDPLVDRLSAEAVALADRISRETRAERQLSEEVG